MSRISASAKLIGAASAVALLATPAYAARVGLECDGTRNAIFRAPRGQDMPQPPSPRSDSFVIDDDARTVERVLSGPPQALENLCFMTSGCTTVFTVERIAIDSGKAQRGDIVAASQTFTLDRRTNKATFNFTIEWRNGRKLVSDYTYLCKQTATPDLPSAPRVPSPEGPKGI